MRKPNPNQGRIRKDACVSSARVLDALHEIQNPLAGARAALQIICQRATTGEDRVILAEALERLGHADAVIASLLRDVRTVRDDASGVHGRNALKNPR